MGTRVYFTEYLGRLLLAQLSTPVADHYRRGKSQPGRGQTKKKIKAPEEEAFLELYLVVFKNGKSPESRTWEFFVCSVTGRSMVDYEKKEKKSTFAA